MDDDDTLNDMGLDEMLDLDEAFGDTGSANTSVTQSQPSPSTSSTKSPITTSASTPFQTSSTLLASVPPPSAHLSAPPMALKRSSDHVVEVDPAGDMDDWGTHRLHFGQKNGGLDQAKPTSNGGSATGVTTATSHANGKDQPQRKRLRRGTLGDTATEDDSSRPVSSPGSRITSPAESDHSSAPALTSPPSAPGGTGAGGPPSSAQLRDHLARFKVDSSAPSSSASSVNGGGTPAEPADGEGDDLDQSQPVVIPGIAGKRKLNGGGAPTLAQEELVLSSSEASSPPVPRAGGRLVRGRPPVVQDSPASVIDLRSSPVAGVGIPLPGGGGAPGSPSPFQTAPTQSPYFAHQQSPSGSPHAMQHQGQPQLYPSPPLQQVPPHGSPIMNIQPMNLAPPSSARSPTPPPGANPGFDQLVSVFHAVLPRDQLWIVWKQSNGDLHKAAGYVTILTKQSQNGGGGGFGLGMGGVGMTGVPQGMGAQGPGGMMMMNGSPRLQGSMTLSPAPHPAFAAMTPGGSQPQLVYRASPGTGYPSTPGSQPQPTQIHPQHPQYAQFVNGAPGSSPQPGYLSAVPAGTVFNQANGVAGVMSQPGMPPQPIRVLPPNLPQNAQMALQQHQVRVQGGLGGLQQPGAVYTVSPNGQPVRVSGGQFYGLPAQSQSQPPQQQPTNIFGHGQPLIRALGPTEPITPQYIKSLLEPKVLLSIPPSAINQYLTTRVQNSMTNAERSKLSDTWKNVQAYRQKAMAQMNAQTMQQQGMARGAGMLNASQMALLQNGRPVQGGSQQQRSAGAVQRTAATARPVPTPPKPQSVLERTLAAVPLSRGRIKKKKKTRPTSDSDGDAGYSDGSGDEYELAAPTPAQVARQEALALEFFNTCTKEELCELGACNPAQAALVMKLRPFESPNDFRTRTRKQKGVGNFMLEGYLQVVEGMHEVDKVLTECEEIGRALGKIMRIWAKGAAKPEKEQQASTDPDDVGLDIVTIADEQVIKIAEASNDPEVQEAFKDYLKTQPEGVPPTIMLKDYQMLGVNWLNLLYRRRTSCILADDMGLGKTAQVISLFAHLKATGEPGPHLVIVPSSTLENWLREFSVFAPGINVQSYYGSQAERAEIRHELRHMEGLDVVVTTYNIASSSVDDQKFLKKKMGFKTCVFDEGHQLKNSESKKHKELMQIKVEWRCLLTGTPLQNNLQELMSLLAFILPDQFREAGDSLRAIFKVTPGAQANLLSRERISRAKKMMTPFVLRRKKAQVLKDLPNKTEHIEWCRMTDLQREVYNEAMQRSKATLLETKDEDLETIVEEGEEVAESAPKPKKRGPKAVASTTKTGNKSDQTSSSNVLMDLRKASNHPMLFRRLYDEKKLKLMAKDCLKEEEFLDRNKDLIFEDMEVMTDFELHRFCLGYKHLEKYALKNNEWMSAGKIEILSKMLPELKAKGDRVLLFSQFTQILDILEVVLNTLDIRYLKLTGQTNVTERQGLVDEYTNDPDIFVFLLSTKAGGLGLNLTAANTVIIHDMDYNPHNDKQAEDRSYRIGQTRDVKVIKLITKDSLEEQMRELASIKLQLDDSVSSASQYPTGAQDADSGAGGDGSSSNGAQIEKKIRSSLLSNLKKKFKEEEDLKSSQAVPSSSPEKK